MLFRSEAYANRQMKGKFPGCVLHIDLPLHMVDVNVHPAKTVVKFVNERAVFSAVHHTVKDALDAAARPAPAVTVPAAPPEPVQAAAPKPKDGFYQTMDAKTFREQAAPPREKPGGLGTPLSSNTEMGKRLTFRDSMRPVPAPPAPKEEPPQYAVRTFASALVPEAEPVAVESPAAPEAEAVETVREPEQTSLPAGPAPWRFAGEVLHTYIIAEDGENVWLIDKHAAHERINFDRLKANPEPVMRQQLLAPLAVELPGEQYAALLENLPLLGEFGFEAEDFGTGCLMVRAVPSDIDAGLVRETLEMLAEKLLTAGGADPAAARDAMLHTMACKAAIKGGWSSDRAELEVLIRKVQSGEVQFCPHGRPVKVRLSRYEIEKMFKRA